EADGSLLAHQDGENRAVLSNTGTAPVRAHVTYVGASGTFGADRVLAPGETATARAIDGQLVLSGPEYEHLLAARSNLVGLQTSTAAWRSDTKISASAAGRLNGLASAAITQIDTATGESTASEPDTAGIAATVAAASHAVAQLSTTTSMPADVRTEI